MTTEQRIYDSRVSDLEEKVSYGTLAILEKLAIHTNDSFNNKKNLLLINGDTIIRNCYNNKLSRDNILKQITFDFNKLEYFYNQYISSNEVNMFIYFHPGIYQFILELYRRTITTTRHDIYKLSSSICVLNAFQFNKFTRIENNLNINEQGCCIKNTFAYRCLPNLINSQINGVKKIWLVTHCPIDYFLYDTFKNIDVILSHTGEILSPKQFGKKVFGVDKIPFNKTTYKFFGDKEFIDPICTNKPKAIEILLKENVHLRTEHEILNILIRKFNLKPKIFEWNF